MNTNIIKVNHLTSYQQKLIVKLSNAVEAGNAQMAQIYARMAISDAQKRQCLQLRANVHFLMYNLYMQLKNYSKAETEIDFTILYIKKAQQSNGCNDKDLALYRDSLIYKASLYIRMEKYQEAIPVYTEALEVSLDMDDVMLSISISETLGICQRALGNHNAAWSNLVSGWELIETLGEAIFHSGQFCKLYALEMMKISPAYIEVRYINRFNSLWGEDWEKRVYHNST